MASLKIRGSKYYAQYYVAGKQRRVALDTISYQLAKEKVRPIESAFLNGSAVKAIRTRVPAQVPWLSCKPAFLKRHD